ncbi:unnamed protein product [Cylicocyclus nassatus]|uniref:Uncharacterized protein n=1 Tax=Cylicocyclus nassatus TaxID=53992 RepID=A0AA36GZX6_CYLNA|nr:unnamed protein product [Cylicocyclus nassatus]
MQQLRLRVCGADRKLAIVPLSIICHSRHLAPPTPYHCPVCDVFCFRQDHHSSFSGVRVGRFNQSYTCDSAWSQMDGALIARLISVHQFSAYLLCFHIYVSVGDSRIPARLFDSLRQYLGTRWSLIFISPSIPSPLPLDGMSFVTRSKN